MFVHMLYVGYGMGCDLKAGPTHEVHYFGIESILCFFPHLVQVPTVFCPDIRDICFSGAVIVLYYSIFSRCIDYCLL